MQVILPPETEQFIRRQIASGRYHDAGEIVGEAMQLLQAREQSWHWQAEHEAQLQRRLAAGLAEADRGELLDADDVFAELERQAEQALAARPQ